MIYSAVFFGLAGGVKWSGLFASMGYLGVLIYIYIIKYPLKDRFRGYRLTLYGLFSYLIIGVLRLLFDILYLIWRITHLMQS